MAVRWRLTSGQKDKAGSRPAQARRTILGAGQSRSYGPSCALNSGHHAIEGAHLQTDATNLPVKQLMARGHRVRPELQPVQSPECRATRSESEGFRPPTGALPSGMPRQENRH